MKLRIDDKWKWLAMDNEKDWWVYSTIPNQKGVVWTNQDEAESLGDIFTMPDLPWKESLYRRVGQEWVRHVELELEKDDPVMVRYENGEWFPRHFSNYEDGVIWCFIEGTTSFTSNGNTDRWTEWKLPEEV